MSIKQQGGIFGRNPTFNNLNVDGTLTVDQIVERTGAAGITLDGVTLKDGNVVLANGKGIDFSATAGTGTSELFDDYEEGTWTPTVGNSTDEIGTWDTSFDATYVKVGRLVTCNMVINGTGMGFSTTTGSRQYTSLPFQPMDNGSGVYGTSSFGQGGGVTIFAGSSSIYLNRPYDTAGVSQIYATFSYQTNA